MRGNLITTTTPHTRDLLVKPSPPAGANVTPAQLTAYEAAKDVWEKKNAQGLGLIQATVSHVIWVKHQTLSTAKEVLDALETEFGKAGGGTDLPPIGQYGENSIHQFDGSITTDPSVPGQLQPDHVKWPQQALQRPSHLHVLLKSSRLI